MGGCSWVDEDLVTRVESTNFVKHFRSCLGFNASRTQLRVVKTSISRNRGISLVIQLETYQSFGLAESKFFSRLRKSCH